jgi:DNA-binding transcriptional ArsR family regulator
MVHRPVPRIENIDDPRYVKAMSHPVRIRIVAMLRERKATPSQLAEWLQLSLGLVAYHVRTLERLGLIELVEETRVRGAVAHHYRATKHPIVTDEAWAAAPPIAKQAAVSSALTIIHEYAAASSGAGGFDRPEAQLIRSDLKLDAKGWAELSKAMGRLLDEVQRIEASAAERAARHPHEEELTNASVVLLAFDAVSITGGEHGHTAGQNRRKRERSRRN